MPEGDYFIDVGKDNNGFKLIIKDTSGNVAKVFDDTLALVQGAWNEVSQLIENYHLMIYGRIKAYRDGDLIFDFFKRALFVIFLEQDASYLASLDGYKIKYPDFTYYIATLYKIYKAFINPKSTLDPQEFVLIIGPLITRVEPNITGQELVSLFDNFAAIYYKAIDYIKRERIGINFMPTAEQLITTQPNTTAIQANEITNRPSTVVTQPNAVATQPSTTVTQPNAVAASSKPLPPPPQVIPPKGNQETVQSNTEAIQPNIEKPEEHIPTPAKESIPTPPEENKSKVHRNIKIEHKRPKHS